MKLKRLFVLCLALFLPLNFFPSPVSASEGLIKPDSKFYFLQSWGESLKLFFTRSSKQKFNYLLELADRRVGEMEDTPSLQVANRYEEHFRKLTELSNQMEGKDETVDKIKEANLRQQEVLVKVFSQVPENAKDAIINAQENSSKHVAQAVEQVEGSQKAKEYLQQVERLQQVEKMGQVEQLELAPMEGDPSQDPSQSTPRGLKDNKGLLPGQKLKPLNPARSQQGNNGGNGRMVPAKPVEMNAPVGQN